MISLVINTVAGAPHAKHVMSSGRVPYSWRAYALRHFILPHYIQDPNIDEVIVAGVWFDAPGFTYVPVEPFSFNWADCIDQRQAGFEAASGNKIIFQHDDHILWTKDLARITAMEGDVISPARCTQAREFVGERLNDGSRDGYIDGHCAMYSREVIKTCPWGAVPRTFTLDKSHTKQIQDAGFDIVWTDAVRCWDVEHGATPWL